MFFNNTVIERYRNWGRGGFLIYMAGQLRFGRGNWEGLTEMKML